MKDPPQHESALQNGDKEPVADTSLGPELLNAAAAAAAPAQRRASDVFMQLQKNKIKKKPKNDCVA